MSDLSDNESNSDDKLGPLPIVSSKRHKMTSDLSQFKDDAMMGSLVRRRRVSPKIWRNVQLQKSTSNRPFHLFTTSSFDMQHVGI